MPMNKKEIRFFIASTFDEFTAEYFVIKKLLLEAGFKKPVPYAYSSVFGSQTEIHNFIENFDYGILLIGSKYNYFASSRKYADENGIIMLGRNLDIEYAKLIESNCKILPFVKKSSIYTTDKKVHLNNFNRRVFNSVSVHFWENEDELAQKILNTLNYLSSTGSGDNVMLYQNKFNPHCNQSSYKSL